MMIFQNAINFKYNFEGQVLIVLIFVLPINSLPSFWKKLATFEFFSFFFFTKNIFYPLLYILQFYFINQDSEIHYLYHNFKKVSKTIKTVNNYFFPRLYLVGPEILSGRDFMVPPHSTIPLIRPCFARALCCTHSFTRSLISFTSRSWERGFLY